ncbi:MAG TPA: hypothetical protein VFN48_09935 [Solirubrobacteraceae bacterium]|nr:hypothetical protein [Solirubrobacteraceae bacterium]
MATTGRCPASKILPGQENLPVLHLPEGSTVTGSAAILAGAAEHPEGA